MSQFAAYKGPVQGFNPWRYVSEADRLAAERSMIEQGGPAAWQGLGRADPRRPLPYDPIAHQQNVYGRWLEKQQEDALQMGPTVGAAAATALDFMPGPGEAFPFMPGGLGMAAGRKTDSILDYFSPEGRKLAEEEAAKHKDEMMQQLYDYGGEKSPYESMVKPDDLQNRTIDPDTGQPIERKVEQIDWSDAKKELPKVAEKPAPKLWETGNYDDLIESLGQTGKEGSWDKDYWNKFHEDNNYEIYDSWKREWLEEDYYGHYAGEIPTHRDALDGMVDGLDNHEYFIAEELAKKIKKTIPNDWINPDGETVQDINDVMPKDFIDWAKKEYPDEFEEIAQNGYISDENNPLIDEFAEEMGQKKTREYIESERKRIEAILEDPKNDWIDEDLDWYLDEDHDYFLADYGSEKPLGSNTRERHWHRQFRDQREAIENATDSKTADTIVEEAYALFEPYRNQSTKDWFREWAEDYTDNFVEDMVDDSHDWKNWDEDDLRDFLKESWKDQRNWDFYRLKEAVGGRIGDDKARQAMGGPSRKDVQKNIGKMLDEIYSTGEQSIDKALENDDMARWLKYLQRQAQREVDERQAAGIYP